MRAVAYTRVSTQDEDQLNSLHNQIQYYTKLFETNKYDVAKIGVYYERDGSYKLLDGGIFADEGITGTQMRHRKAFNEMIKFAERGMFDVILCKNVMRFARNTGEGSTTLKKLKSWGVRVIFEEGNLDSSNKNHELVIDMMLSVAQSESQSKSESVKFGIKQAQKEGKWTSATPLGYDIVDGYLKINPQEAKIVKSIYEMYAHKRYGFNKIAKELNKTNPKPNGKYWYYSQIKKVTTDPLYKGVQITHKVENMDVNVDIQKEIPEEDWIIHNKPELQIIDNDLWQQVQDIYKKQSDKYGKGRVTNTHTFSGLLRCDNCGSRLHRCTKTTTRKSKKIYLDKYEWVCANNHLKGKEVCKYRNFVNEDVLHQYAKDMIIQYRKNTDLLDRSFNMYLNIYLDDSNVEQTIASINIELEKIKEQQKNRLHLYDQGILTQKELEEYMTNTYRPQHKKLTDEKLKYSNIEQELKRAKRQYLNFKKELNKIDVDNLKNADLKKVFAGIYVGTYREFNSSSFIFNIDSNEYSFDNPTLDKIPYTWVNKNKGTFKHLSSEVNFMNINEMELFQHVAEKDYQEKIANGEIAHDEIVTGDIQPKSDEDLELTSYRLRVLSDKLKD